MSIAHAARPYERLLARLPDEVMLEIAGHEFEMCNENSCVCGWALRAVIARLEGHYIDDVDIWYADGYGGDVPGTLAKYVGGTSKAWERLFYAVTDERLPAVEYAFVRRLNAIRV
jgi:hypothetical protein